MTGDTAPLRARAMPLQFGTGTAVRSYRFREMCNLYSRPRIKAIIALLRVLNRHVGNLPPMPGVFPDYPALVIRNAGAERELTMM